ncbi:hypothetical protein IscW_ISCW003718, partial [Ixodes scapularis]
NAFWNYHRHECAVRPVFRAMADHSLWPGVVLSVSRRFLHALLGKFYSVYERNIRDVFDNGRFDPERSTSRSVSSKSTVDGARGFVQDASARPECISPRTKPHIHACSG